MIAVTFALPAESAGFLRRLHKKSTTDRNGVRVIRGEIDNPEMIGAREALASRTVEVVHTGVGEKVCRDRMAKFLQDRQFDCLISAGFLARGKFLDCSPNRSALGTFNLVGSHSRVVDGAIDDRIA